MPAPQPLFLVGVGRSGTTALAEIFSDHPRVVMGMERFKALWANRLDELTPELLQRERFLDFGDGLTNIRPDVDPRWETYYAKQRERFNDAAYVGDKMTVARMDGIWESLPDARFVCIVREAGHVAASWDARAQRASDVNWPERLNSERAIAAWNRNNTRIRRARRERPDQVAVIEYADFYGDPEAGSLRRVLDWLGLEFAPEVEASFAAAREVYVAKVEGKDRALSPAAQAFVDEQVNPQLWKHLMKLKV